MSVVYFLIIGLMSQEDKVAKKTPPTPNQVIDRFIEAKGGLERMKKVKNYILKGEINVNGELMARFETYQAHGRHLAIRRYPDGTSERDGTDGKTVWSLDQNKKAIILKGEKAQEYMRHNSTVNEALDWKKQIKTIEYAGKARVGGIEAHKLTFVDPKGKKIHRYFAVDSGLFVREEYRLPDKGRTRVVSEIKDYKASKGGNLVSRRRINRHGDTTIEFKLRAVMSNSIKDNSIFALPKQVRDLQADSNHR